MTIAAATRWRPTPDQLMILEKLYMGGIKTPSAGQIQRITAHLSLYGKIECKNVFYWFQNHKAREKQKIRKRLLLSKQRYHYSLQHPPPPPDIQLLPGHHHHHHLLQGPQCYHHSNAQLYLLEPAAVAAQYTGLLPSQGRVKVRCGSPQMLDSTWARNCTGNKDDGVMTPAAPATAASSLETLELFPTTSIPKLRLPEPRHHPCPRPRHPHSGAILTL